jgi:hypothetical protein
MIIGAFWHGTRNHGTWGSALAMVITLDLLLREQRSSCAGNQELLCSQAADLQLRKLTFACLLLKTIPSCFSECCGRTGGKLVIILLLTHIPDSACPGV